MVRAHALVGSVFALLSFAAIAPACSTTDGAEVSCSNGTRDGDEIGVDCGGSCGTKCTGAGCVDGAECASGKCESGACAAPAGKPCGVGTTTPSCADGQPCELNDDCKSGSCDAAKCVPTKPGDTPPGPNDGKQNNGESDVDCGGASAPKCADGKKCTGDDDCATGYCDASKICKTPRYDDGVKNGSETDIDCGGTTTAAGFKKCTADKACLVDTDCIGACNYEKKCVDVPSCKVHFGGDTCGPDEVRGATKQESCCKSLPVPGFTDPSRPGKTVYLDKYEITAGRVRAWLESIPGQNVKSWIAANPPQIWHASWTQFLPSGTGSETINVPRKPTSENEAPPWSRNLGTNFQFNQQLFVYVHGHKCGNEISSYGMPTFWYPAAVMTANGGLPRANPNFDGMTTYPAQEALDVKAMNCITSAMLQAFCSWDGGQLATDEVLDFVTGAPASLLSTAGCGTRCAPMNEVIASSDSGVIPSGVPTINYYFPYYNNGSPSAPETHEGTSYISAPGRKMTGGPKAGQQSDVVRINAGDEPWMELHGNVHEIALDTTNGAINPQATGQGSFHVKYRGIGYSSARAGGNSLASNLSYPEYRAAYSGGRCMRFK
ncbi:MAG: hypothetical protein JST00_22225 [Deltaproteobacteria bacterium]|nr:hypothetical protein [Deltaproteobacteria bacterium]